MKRLIGCLLLVWLHASSSHADTLEQIRQRGELRWGADKTGGGPYLYKENNQLVGFEVELSDYLAAELGVRGKMVHGQWGTLPARLDRGDLDVVLNGYEWSEERAREWAVTIPYYIYKVQLIARKNDPSIQSWDDLRVPPGQRRKRVGVLSNTGAHRYLKEHWSDAVQIEAYSEGVTSAMSNVENEQLDATVQDLPSAIHYLKRDFSKLRFVGEPVAEGYYVILCPHQDGELRDALNLAIRKALSDGTLQRIYAKYDIWTADQARLSTVWADWPAETPAPSWGTGLGGYAWTLAEASLITILLSFLSMPLAMALGMLVAVGRLYGPRWLAGLCVTYVEILRGTPLLLQLYAIYFILPRIGVRLDPITAGVLGLAVNYSAYESENYRAGILAVPAGQMEAALALGMSMWVALRRVIIPQAFRIVVPLEVNNFIALFKDTSICSIIAVTELTGQYNELLNDQPRYVLALGLMTALLYLLMSYPLALLSKYLEKRVPRVAG